MTGYDCYVLYLALKTHFFTEKYDFFKFHGKIKASKESFEKRRDKYYFKKLAIKYNKDSLVELFIANFVKEKYWVGDLIKNGEENYVSWKRAMGSLSYNFKQEVSMILDEVENFNELFKVESGQHPIILKYYIAQKISLETLCILNNRLNFSKHFDRDIQENFIWPQIKLKIVKYTPFIFYDEKKFNEILKNLVLDTATHT